MARRFNPKVSLHAQLVAVRRAASNAAVRADHDSEWMSPGIVRKKKAHRDALAQAAATLHAVQASREALDMLPDAQRDKLAIALAAAGYRAVRVEGEVEMAEPVHD